MLRHHWEACLSHRTSRRLFGQIQRARCGVSLFRRCTNRHPKRREWIQSFMSYSCSSMAFGRVGRVSGILPVKNSGRDFRTMHREQNPNIEILEIAVDALGPLADEVVFLGGCATGLLLTDVAAPPIRATQDVDVITEAASLADYYRLSEQLRERGFTEDQSPEAPSCRWKAKGILLDVMPTNPDILGFGNEWYQAALGSAEYIDLPSENTIRMVTAPYFLATKLSAFDGRGEGDYLMSHDIEDIVAVLDGRTEVVDEVQASPEELRSHLAERFQALLDDARFVEAVSGHLQGDMTGQGRVTIVMERIRSIAEVE